MGRTPLSRRQVETAQESKPPSGYEFFGRMQVWSIALALIFAAVYVLVNAIQSTLSGQSQSWQGFVASLFGAGVFILLAAVIIKSAPRGRLTMPWSS